MVMKEAGPRTLVKDDTGSCQRFPSGKPKHFKHEQD